VDQAGAPASGLGAVVELGPIAVALAIAAGACGDSGSGAPVDAGGSADARVATLDGPCELADRVGSFAVAHEDGFSLVSGSVSDAVEPNTVLQLEYQEGGCVFLRKLNPFCDPPCAGGETCDLTDTCVPAPRRLSAGTVTVDGLLADVVMEPNEVNKEYQDATVPHPPFAPGAAVTLSAAGAQTEPFVLDGVGVEPLLLASTVWTMVAGQPMAIEWTPSTGPGKIFVSLNVDLHGNSPVTMYCTFDDTGAATIPEALVSRLIDYGVTQGFASAHAYRRTVDRVDIEQGCVDFIVDSHVKPQFALQQP